MRARILLEGRRQAMLTAAVLFQSQLATDHSNLLIVFIAVVAAAVVLQAIVLIAMAVGAAKTQKQALGIIQEFQSKAFPLIDSAARVMEQTAPKVGRIADNLVESSDILREKAHELDLVVSEIAAKTRSQVNRVDGAVTDTFNTVGRVTAEVHHAIMVPVKHISGVLNGVRAGIESLMGRFRSFKDQMQSGVEDELE